MSSTNKKNINNYCIENIKFIYKNFPSEYRKKFCMNIRSICEVYDYMEFEILCIRDICKSNNCLNYFKKLNLLPVSLIEVEIEDKYFPEKKLYRDEYDKLFSSLIKIRPYIEYYYDIYTKYMKIEVENIPPNSTIEFYNSRGVIPFNNTSKLQSYKPKSMKIIKVCNKIVKFKFEGDLKYSIITKEDLKDYLHYTCYKIY